MPTILIAEDNDDLRGMLKEWLGAKGYGVLEATDGKQATSLALTERPDLILMDLGLPGADGLSAVAEIRERIPTEEMPIIMVSAYDRLEYRMEAISAGCCDYMIKPLDLATLLHSIKLLLDS